MEQIEITTKEAESGSVNLRRLYGEFNRETISRLKERGLTVAEEPYDLDEVMRYLRCDDERNKKQLEDRNAMKAQIFYEWLNKKGIERPEMKQVA
jgi:hypothetical protein